jgi:hypothetical protein
MFARTKKGVEFRAWVLDQLDAQAAPSRSLMAEWLAAKAAVDAQDKFASMCGKGLSEQRTRKPPLHIEVSAITEALKTTKKTSWQASRAALLHSARAGLEGYLAQQDQVQRACKAADLVGQPADWDLWMLMVKRADDCARAVQAVRAAALPLAGRVDRHTKRQDMAGLPPDWRERPIERMPTYRLATLTAAVTGCRPAELVRGVRMSIEGGMLVAFIRGAKVDVARGKGQEWRRLEWPLDHPSAMVRELGGEVATRRRRAHGHHRECLKFQQVDEQCRGPRVAETEDDGHPVLFPAPVRRGHEGGRRAERRRNLCRARPPERCN